MSNQHFDDDIFNGMSGVGEPVWKKETKPFAKDIEPQPQPQPKLSMREMYEKMIQQGERVKILNQDGNLTGTVVGISSIPAPIIGSIPAYIVEVDNATEVIQPFKDEEGEIPYPYTHTTFAAALVHLIDEDTTEIERVFGAVSKRILGGEEATDKETDDLLDVIHKLEKERGA